MRALLVLGAVACVGCGGPLATATPLPQAAVPAVSNAEPAEAPATAGSPETASLIRQLHAAERSRPSAARWQSVEKIFADIRTLGDPNGAVDLLAYLKRTPRWGDAGEAVHFRTEAALALAELGDPRAAPMLAKRLRLDPVKLYSDKEWLQAARAGDRQRVVAARLIGDLAALHPAQRAELRKIAGDAVLAWVLEYSTPHANGLRALALLKANDAAIARRIRAWADPELSLPELGAQPPFPEELAVAQIGLRYLGAQKDEQSWSILKKQLERRPKGFDASLDALMRSGVAMRGMAVRALGVGAADGFSELGDARATPLLLTHIANDRENEHSRWAACAALAWLFDTQSAPEVVRRLRSWQKAKGNAAAFKFKCLLYGLTRRPRKTLAPVLLGMMSRNTDLEVRFEVARALGKAGVDGRAERKLISMLSDDGLRRYAALALILGGSVKAAELAAQTLSREEQVQGIREPYSESFEYLSQADLDEGRLFRVVANALAVSRLKTAKSDLSWVQESLAKQLVNNLQYDNGPHSLTRVMLRFRLHQLAKGDDPSARRGALDTLQLMDGRGNPAALVDAK